MIPPGSAARSGMAGDKALALGTEAQPTPCRSRFAKNNFREIVSDHGKLYLRVVSTVPLKSGQLTVVTSEPFDKELVGKIASRLGEITLYMSKIDTNELLPGPTKHPAHRMMDCTPLPRGPRKKANRSSSVTAITGASRDHPFRSSSR